MTQEEKAQAYDEALNKAKIEINTKGIGEAVDLCYQLFPELAENDDEESEDEQTRKWIWNLLHRLHYNEEDHSMALKAIEWLEKQKESSHISEMCKENANSFIDGIIEVRSFQRGMEEGRKLEKQKEQKQAQTSEEKEYVRTIKSIISDFIRDKKPENLAHYQRIYDWLDGRHVPFSCGHENGEPADPVFSKQEYESYPIISEDTTSTKPVEFDGKTLLYTADKSYQIGFRDGVASVKPAEWSESDKDVLMDAICATDKLGNNEVYNKNNPNLAKAFRVAKDWLKNLPERFNLQPKQERSEEDEKTYTFVCNYFETCWWSKTWDISREQVLKMLKSLHSQSKQEWKEEDEEMRDTCIDLLEHFPRPCGEVIGPWKDCISWLKSLRPQPKQEWSEENEKDVAHIIRILDDCYAYGKHDLSKTDHENLVGTLKSLRLQPKLEWSEEDEHRRDGIIQWLREYQAKFNLKYDSLSIESIESLIDWLKSIRPSWKPSEEQMEALKLSFEDAFNDAGDCNRYRELKLLYEQLKNL